MLQRPSCVGTKSAKFHLMNNTQLLVNTQSQNVSTQGLCPVSSWRRPSGPNSHRSTEATLCGLYTQYHGHLMSARCGIYIFCQTLLSHPQQLLWRAGSRGQHAKLTTYTGKIRKNTEQAVFLDIVQCIWIAIHVFKFEIASCQLHVML